MNQSTIPQPALYLPLNDRVGMSFQLIPAGSFRMGSRGNYADEEPTHTVRITHPFYLGTFPVTQLEWRAVVERIPDTSLEPEPSHFDGDQLPVEQVSLDDVENWCDSMQKMGILEGLANAAGEQVTVSRFGLPTEAQWEYACRAETETDYYAGDGDAALLEAGWFDENSDDKTHPVGEKTPNTWGLYDMHGNVWEWCRDAWDADAYKKRVDGDTDPEVRVEDVNADDLVRVVRGGSWLGGAADCRAAIRGRRGPGGRNWVQGFRVCLVPGPVPS